MVVLYPPAPLMTINFFGDKSDFLHDYVLEIFREISDLDERQSMLKMLHARGGLYEAIFSDASAL